MKAVKALPLAALFYFAEVDSALAAVLIDLFFFSFFTRAWLLAIFFSCAA